MLDVLNKMPLLRILRLNKDFTNNIVSLQTYNAFQTIHRLFISTHPTPH